MKRNIQGVQQLSRLLMYALLSLIFSASTNTIASATYNIHLLYSSNSMLQSKIAASLTNHLNNNFPDAIVTHLSPIDSGASSQLKPDFIIAIGIDNIKYTTNNFSTTDALLIASNPGEYSQDIKSKNTNTVLYMSQPYCKQIHFIKEINQQWSTISYLKSEGKPFDDKAIKKCTEKYDMNSYVVTTTHNGSTSTDIRNALANSDLILALPNKIIYNGKSVKNILLTSYRSRKPVIGFSKNFVTAGALASIHSDSEQIAQSANSLIDQYYSHNKTFNKKVNYPKLFDISLNNQVFRALNLQTPDIEKLKKTLSNTESTNIDKQP